MATDGADVSQAVDAALKEWRQGDVVLGEIEFLYLADLNAPLTNAARELAAEIRTQGEKLDLEPVATLVPGLVVTTHTCDLVRQCSTRSYVELAPLREVDQATYGLVARGRITGMVVVPAVANRRLVADIDRSMTVEKAVLLRWNRIEGVRDDIERREFARALARKRRRFAFPDDFVALVSDFQRNVVKKHNAKSQEGDLLNLLRYIRVKAEPAWDHDKIELTFIFVTDEGAEKIDPSIWAKQIAQWRSMIKAAGRYSVVEAYAVSVDQMTGRDFEDTDELDFDHLSPA